MFYKTVERAAAECISDDALVHLKSYKYSSVDKSPVSKYILGPWVCRIFGSRGRRTGASSDEESNSCSRSRAILCSTMAKRRCAEGREPS